MLCHYLFITVLGEKYWRDYRGDMTCLRWHLQWSGDKKLCPLPIRHAFSDYSFARSWCLEGALKAMGLNQKQTSCRDGALWPGCGIRCCFVCCRWGGDDESRGHSCWVLIKVPTLAKRCPQNNPVLGCPHLRVPRFCYCLRKRTLWAELNNSGISQNLPQ